MYLGFIFLGGLSLRKGLVGLLMMEFWLAIWRVGGHMGMGGRIYVRMGVGKTYTSPRHTFCGFSTCLVWLLCIHDWLWGGGNLRLAAGLGNQQLGGGLSLHQHLPPLRVANEFKIAFFDVPRTTTVVTIRWVLSIGSRQNEQKSNRFFCYKPTSNFWGTRFRWWCAGHYTTPWNFTTNNDKGFFQSW